MNWLTRLAAAGAATGIVLAAIAPAASASERGSPTAARSVTAARPAAAAGGQAVLTGRVRDGRPLHGKNGGNIVVPNGLPTVAGAVVSLPALGRRTTTDASGRFAFRGLRITPGAAYTLTVRKKGFGSWRERGIKLVPGDPAQLYIQLTSAAQRLTVTRVHQPDNGPAAAGKPNVPGGCTHNSSGWTSQTKEPPKIRVYMTSTGTVSTYTFTFYEEHVLPNEWIPSWLEPALEAGAVAVRDYAWFFVVNGSKGTASGYNPCAFDVDNTTAYQNFVPGNPTYTSTNDAVTNTARYLYVNKGNIPELSYNSGFQGEACGGETITGSMSQWGTQTCAQDGDSWQKILSVYYGYTLTKPGNPPPPSSLPGGPAVFDPIDSAVEVYGTGSNGHLQEDWWSKAKSWQSGQLGVTSPSPVTGKPSAVYDPIAKHLEIFATGQDGQLQEYWWSKTGGWNAGQLMATPSNITGSPAAVYDPVNNAIEIYATGQDGHLQEDWWKNSTWHSGELMATPANITASPSAVYDPIESAVEIYATGTNGQLQENWWNKAASWHAGQLAATPSNDTGSPSAVYHPGVKAIEIYTTGQDGQLQENWWNKASSWHTGELMATPANITASPSAVYDPIESAVEIYATGTNGQLQENWWNKAGNWHAGQLLATPANTTGSPGAIDNPAESHIEIYDPGTNGQWQEAYWSKAHSWQAGQLLATPSPITSNN